MIYLDQLHADADIVYPIWNDPATPAAFRDYWNGERPKVKTSLMFRELARAGDSERCALFPGVYVIFLKRIPPTPADAAVIAHELGHAVLYDQGYIPPHAIDDNAAWGAAKLGSMFQDALIARRMRDYGMDATPDLHFIEAESRPQPADLRNRIIIAWWFMCLQLTHVEATGQRIPTDVVTRWRAKYPAIWQYVEHVESAIRHAGGYETPAQHVAIYRELIARYGLHKEIQA